MAIEIVFDGDDTLNELVDFLIEYMDQDEAVSGVAKLDGKHAGFVVLVSVMRDAELDS